MCKIENVPNYLYDQPKEISSKTVDDAIRSLIAAYNEIWSWMYILSHLPVPAQAWSGAILLISILKSTVLFFATFQTYNMENSIISKGHYDWYT